MMILLFFGGALTAQNTHEARIEVDGRQVYYCTAGEGKPVVIMDAGYRDHSIAWKTVFPELSKITQVFIYDRPGLGKSELSNKTRSSKQSARDLNELLEKAKIEPPYILVGHAYGGWNMRLFLHLYPDKCSGLILLDTPHEDFERRLTNLLTDREKKRRDREMSQDRKNLPEGMKREYDALPESRRQLRETGRMADIPLTVITARKQRMTNIKRAHQVKKTWFSQQQALSNRSPRGKLIIAEECGHYIQSDQPELVIDAVTEMVKRVRTTQNLSLKR